MGVPIAAWPMHSDQPRNTVLITEVLKIGICSIQKGGKSSRNDAEACNEAVVCNEKYAQAHGGWKPYRCKILHTVDIEFESACW